MNEFIHPDDQFDSTKVTEEAKDVPEGVYDYENRYKHKNGKYLLLRWRASTIGDQRIILCMADILGPAN